MSNRTADTSVPITPVQAERWSPRSFDPTHTLTFADLAAPFEAARWSASANNIQPWRFLVALRGDALWQIIVDSLAGFNAAWVPTASAVVLNIAIEENAEGKHNAWARYDLGQAIAHFSVQAHADGLVVHQFSGFARDDVAEKIGLPAGQTIIAAAAVGKLGDPDALGEAIAERERAQRERKPLGEIVQLGA
jgi:nitroreductase